MQTLIIIDMQIAWLEENPCHQLTQVIDHINQLANHFRQLGKPVIFVRHDNADYAKGSPAWQVTPRITSVASDRFVDKSACDSFSNTELVPLLAELKATELVICGLATEFCVDTSIRVALSQGFDVQVMADAHTTANRPHLDAASIIAHHNWVWHHLAAPQNVSIKVLNTAEFLATAN